LPRNVDPQPSAQNLGRGLWLGFAIWSLVRLSWALYEFAQGEGMIYRSLMSSAVLLFCVAQLVTARRRLVYRLLVLLSLVLLLAFVMLFALEARGT
jgi:hypothetical protein